MSVMSKTYSIIIEHGISAPGHGKEVVYGLKTCSSQRRDVRSHSMVCSENSLLTVGIGPIRDKEL